MTRLSEEEILKKIIEHRKEVTSSKEAAREYLCSLGTHNKDGSITKEYSVK
ncbi:MAG: hypothetical protein K8S62_15450 [Candidatus Sabulitectum sp.]|nr:hypothetical protein [Candidatus Sabulitectum sp.]